MPEIQSLAKIYENSEKKQIIAAVENVNAVQKPSYSQMVKTNYDSRGSEGFRKPNHAKGNYPRRFPENERGSRDYVEKSFEPKPIIGERSNNQRLNEPAQSMKQIARRFYNARCGLPEPKDERLRPGHCFCCQESGYFRSQCPMRNRCLMWPRR